MAAVVAVDSPRSPGREGELSRQGERALVHAGVCGIRYTPNQAALDENKTCHAWIVNGFELYAALKAESGAAGWDVIECFPTAIWSRLRGRKGGRRALTGPARCWRASGCRGFRGG